MYRIMRPLLFLLPAEFAHHIVLKVLNGFYHLGLLPKAKPFVKSEHDLIHCMGLNFPNRVGLAAGLDKNAEYVDALSTLGFGWIEIGTVTPKPQAGNPKPRLFRLKKQDAIINRMGFNNKGIDYVAKQLQKIKYRGILGVNIGKNKDTPNERAVDDYLQGFRTLWPYASYITINLSSPNTPGLRDLQQEDQLFLLLQAMKNEQALIQQRENRYVPLVVKIAPDLSHEALAALAKILLQTKIDGVIATNTTISRQGVELSPFAKEAGGLSGKPLTQKSTQIISELNQLLNGKIPIIASGGVMDAQAAADKFKAGACLVQVYTGLVYHGISLIRKIVLMHF